MGFKDSHSTELAGARRPPSDELSPRIPTVPGRMGPGLRNEGTQPLRGGVAVQPGGGDVEGQILPSLRIGSGFDSIQAQEHQAAGQGHALVAVDERMVAAQEEQVGYRHFNKIGVDGSPSEGCLGRRYSRLQSISSRPDLRRNSLARLNGRLPKKPR